MAIERRDGTCRPQAAATWRARMVLLALSLLLAVVAPAASVAAGTATFEAPSASGALGEPMSFRTELRAEVAPARVELLTRLPHDPTAFVRRASVTALGEGRYEAALTDAEHIAPNTTLRYRFRAVMPDGTTVEGPESTLTIADERFDWRTRSDGVVTLHWYEGDDGFADRALRIGSDAIEKASKLLGVTAMPEVDFFVYADQDALYAALGPDTRENVGGQANSDIGTMFGLIGPSEVNSDWVDIVVSHELTHLVFAEAVDNPYHFPPRWLNEGLAVYLAQGYDAGDRATVEQAVRDGSIIPLEGLAGLFPATRDGFSLAYAESVAAVEFFVRTYGETTLVQLIRSYADGVTDDEAFRAAIGLDMAGFDDAWMASIGTTRREPFGPRPAPAGPEPDAWSAAPAASPIAP
jgi:hypothetical protein